MTDASYARNARLESGQTIKVIYVAFMRIGRRLRKRLVGYRGWKKRERRLFSDMMWSGKRMREMHIGSGGRREGTEMVLLGMSYNAPLHSLAKMDHA